MPQDSIIYAVARTRALETRILTREKLKRIMEAPDAAVALRITAEYGYGGGSADYEAMIDYELCSMAEYIKKVTPNIYATGAFLLKYDCHNIKTVIKAKMLGMAPDEMLVNTGNIDAERLKSLLDNGSYKELPPNMALAARAIMEKLEIGSVAPQTVDLELDSACFSDMALYANESRDAFVKECVEAICDLLNFRTLLRYSSGAKSVPIAAVLFSGGSIDKQKFISCVDLSAEEAAKKTGITKYGDAAGIDDYIKTGSAKVLEKKADDYIMGLAKSRRYQAFEVAPLVGYLLAKEREAQSIRLIMVAKANGASDEMIEERLREQYE